jgi:ATP synthase protein I
LDTKPGSDDGQKTTPGWENQVAGKEARKIRGRRRKHYSIWFGLGYFGVIGWSIAIPTLIGIFTGVWIDRNFTSPYSWTLMLMLAGLMLGCLSAWYWISFEGGLIDREDQKQDKYDD